MNFLELQYFVGQWTDDPGFGYFQLPFVKLMINNAATELYKFLNKTGEYRYLKCVETTTVQNQTQYVLPSDFKSVEKLAFITNAGTQVESEQVLAPVTLNQIQNFVTPYADQNGPGIYHLQKNRLVISPKPQVPRTLRLHYAYQPLPMVADIDVPDAPIEYHEYIAVLATKSCFLKDKQPISPVDQKLKEYSEMLKAAAQERHRDMPRMVVETEPDIWGSRW